MKEKRNRLEEAMNKQLDAALKANNISANAEEPQE